MNTESPQELSMEDKEAIEWLIRNRNRAAWKHGADALIVTPYDIFLANPTKGRKWSSKKNVRR